MGDLVAAALPATVTLGRFRARDEVSIVVPGRETLAKYATALQRLASHAVEQSRAIDLGQPRHLLQDGSTTSRPSSWTLKMLIRSQTTRAPLGSRVPTGEWVNAGTSMPAATRPYGADSLRLPSDPQQPPRHFAAAQDTRQAGFSTPRKGARMDLRELDVHVRRLHDTSVPPARASRRRASPPAADKESNETMSR